MEALPRCDELRHVTMSSEWEDMFMLYYRRAIDEDEKLVRAINGLCDGLTVVIKEKENFIDELGLTGGFSLPFDPLMAAEKESFLIVFLSFGWLLQGFLLYVQ
nr:hypothetical protein [Tanacetum cinerariifolium]